MFEFIRNHQRLMQGLLMLIIFPSFAFFGLSSYTSMTGDDNAIVKVAGTSITQQEWDNAQRDQIERLRQRMGERFDSKMLDTPDVKANMLDNLIAQRVLAATVVRKNLSISDQTLQQRIMELPGLMVDGKFDGERYKALLATQGMTPTMFEARFRHDLAVQQVNAAIQGSAFAPKSVATRLSDLNDQEREVQELMFKASDFQSQVKVTDEMLKKYYDDNGRQFEIPEQMKAEYVLLSVDALAEQIQVSDADIKAVYEQNKQRFTVPEQRRASHILIAAKKDAPEAERAEAKAKAERILAQARKSPADFAKLAKENSADTGSAERGGDLDFFGRGMMVKPFEEAAFKMKPNEISDVVQTEFGFHIIMLTAVRAESGKPFDEVKGEIAADLKKQQAQKKFSEMAEVFTNTVYEQSDSLKPVADKLKLKIETAASLTRNPNPALPPAVPYNNAKFLKSLFSDDVTKNKRNTEAVEVAPNTLVSGRVVEYKPASKRPFAEVQAVVRERVVQAEAAKLAKAAGEAKLTALRAKDDSAGFTAAKTVSRTKPGLPGNAMSAVMRADTAKLPSFAGVEYPGVGYAVYRISKAGLPATLDAARRQAEQQQVANTLAQQEMLAYLDALKQKAKVQILKPVVASSSGVSGEAEGK